MTNPKAGRLERSRTKRAPRSAAGPDSTVAALERSRKDLEDLKFALDQSAIVATTDVQGTITYANDKFCEISQYSRAELIGANHRILKSGLHPPEFFRELYRTIAGGRVWRGEIRNRAKDGSFYWVDTTIVPFVDARGRPYQYVSIRYEITERKRSEATLREQASLARLGKMAAIVAHEVRNPLAGIRGAVQIIGRRIPAESPEAAIAKEIVTRIDTLNNIVEDLLLFARPKPPVLTPVSLTGVIEETLPLFHADPKTADVTVDLDVPELTTMADAEQLKLVLVNLLLNAAQAMQGRGRILVTGRAAGAWHELRIIDQGPGIAADAREYLFEPFFTTKHKGTGLGLATARRILEGHGGTIELECPEGGGTIAVIRLPTKP
jgi:PAS domain S-box-containing protein